MTSGIYALNDVKPIAQSKVYATSYIEACLAMEGFGCTTYMPVHDHLTIEKENYHDHLDDPAKLMTKLAKIERQLIAENEANDEL